MSLKLIFLGSGSAFTLGPENFQSNLLLELGQESLLIDAGQDIKYSLKEQNKDHAAISHIYISHLHGDHCGGLEWLALNRFFYSEQAKKPALFAAESILDELWEHALRAGLSTLPKKTPSIHSFFDLRPIAPDAGFIWHSIEFTLVQTVHYYSGYRLMPSFGLLFRYHKTRIFFTADTQSGPKQLLEFYEEADIIFHDCETSVVHSGVHAHYSELRQLPTHVKNKMWLYHYNHGTLPDAKKDGFLGFVVKGQCFLFD